MSINTELYINNFNLAHATVSVPKWIHDHPTVVKALQVVGLILGGAMIAASPILLPIIGITVGVIGGALTLAAVISWLFLNFITCQSHPIDQHAYHPAQCDYGRLYYRGNIPVLELNASNTPHQSGMAHGLLLGSRLCELKKVFDVFAVFIHLLEAGQFSDIVPILTQSPASRLSNMLEQVKKTMRQSDLDEMQGLADGYNQWALNAGINASITLDEILLLHLLPDSKHFHPGHIENQLRSGQQSQVPSNGQLQELNGMACTALLHRDPHNGIVFGRNMDWLPFGDGGGQSLLIVDHRVNIAYFGAPGMIGVVTGWNRDGLTLAMNVCPGETSTVRGMPAILFNRVVLEERKSAAGVLELIENNSPLGPYHMTFGDVDNEGACVSFYQGEQEGHYIRELDDGPPLQVVNWRYPDCRGGSFNSQGRCDLLTPYFQNAIMQIPSQNIDWFRLIENALQQAPLVNSPITMHSFMFRPSHDEAWIGWDNGFAASTPRERLKLSEVF